jgi:hypothetical protein
MKLTQDQLNLARSRALCQWTTQLDCPNSPGSFGESAYTLCLGAVLAESLTCAFLGQKDAIGFTNKLRNNGSKEQIVAQLELLGYSRTYAEEKIYINDSTPSANRRKVLTPILETESTYFMLNN